MTMPRRKLSDHLLLVLACGVAFAAYRYLWQPPPDPNYKPSLSAYLVLLATASLGSFFARPTWRRLSQGYAMFGWCNLIFVMRGGFAMTSLFDAAELVQDCRMGVVFGVLAALVAVWLLEPPTGGQGHA